MRAIEKEILDELVKVSAQKGQAQTKQLWLESKIRC